MNRTRKWLFYAVYISITASVFLYVRFPSDAVKNYLRAWVQESRTDIRIEMAQIKPVLPPGLEIRSPSLSYRGDAIFNADTARLSPRYKTVFREQPRVRFSAAAYGGWVDGDIAFTANSPVAINKIDARIEQLKIERLNYFQEKQEDTISGLLNGTIVFSASPGSGQTADIKLSISDCAMPVLSKISNRLKEVFFETIDIEMALRGARLQIKRCRYKGPQIDGRMTGTVVVQAPAGKSLLNLTGSLKLKHLLLAGFADESSKKTFSKQMPGRGDLPFRIGGTLEAPNFSFR